VVQAMPLRLKQRLQQPVVSRQDGRSFSSSKGVILHGVNMMGFFFLFFAMPDGLETQDQHNNNVEVINIQ
jgi:hypothetical protein